jgi:signal transduction histidine kinase
MEGVTATWRRWLRSPYRDAVVAVILTVILVYGSYGEGHPQGAADRVQFRGHPVPHPTAALLLVAAACLVLAWRRRWPVAVLAISIAAVTAYTLLGYVNGAALIAPVIALYAVATRLSALRAVAAGLVTVGVLMAASAARNPFGYISAGGYYLIPLMGVAVVFGGIAVVNRRAYAASIRDRAEQDARRRLDEERLRIARELHDVVAHTMATINVQAGVAVHVLPTRPEVAADALQAIKTASKEGLRELRAILDVLRQADDADPVQPAPGLAQLDALIDGARRAGLQTTLTVTGEPFPLPAAVDLAAYRIVQESLTNVIRHAGPATAAVVLSYRPDELGIDVTDTGRGPADSPPSTASATSTPSASAVSAASTAIGTTGHGLAGMRERAATVGGTVLTGPGPGGGYHVTARLPVNGRPASARADVPGEGARP